MTVKMKSRLDDGISAPRETVNAVAKRRTDLSTVPKSRGLATSVVGGQDGTKAGSPVALNSGNWFLYYPQGASRLYHINRLEVRSISL